VKRDIALVAEVAKIAVSDRDDQSLESESALEAIFRIVKDGGEYESRYLRSPYTEILSRPSRFRKK
jgi:hypothetical protein